MTNAINDELRREIATDLRKSGTIMPLIDVFRDRFLFAEGDSLALFAADLIDRPTCQNIGGEEGTNGEGYDFYCTECGFAADVTDANYCPWCGTEVVANEMP